MDGADVFAAVGDGVFGEEVGAYVPG